MTSTEPSLPRPDAASGTGSRFAPRFEMIDDLPGLDRLESAWRRLEESSATSLQLFQTFTWNRCWAEEFAGGRSPLRVLAGFDGDELVVVWPMVIGRHGPVRMLEPTGGLLSTFNDALVRDGESRSAHLAAAWDELRACPGVDGISLPAVHADAAVAEVVAANCGEPIKATTAPAIDLTRFDDYDAFLAGCSKGLRKELRRTRRDLEKLGNLEHRVNEITPTEAVHLTLDLTRDGLQARGLSGRTVMSSQGTSFLCAVTERIAAENGATTLRFSTQHLDDRIIAVGIGIVFGGRVYEYLGGFDYELASKGPGKLQLTEGIRAAFEAGDTVCDLLTPETDFKCRFTPDRPEVRHYFAPLNRRGRIYSSGYLRTARPVARQVYRETVPRLRRWNPLQSKGREVGGS